jgi:hypothetical protein
VQVQTPPLTAPDVAVQMQEAPVQSAEAPISVPAAPRITDRVLHLWPEGEPLPTHYEKHKRSRLPCPKCRRVLLDGIPSQAVEVRSSGAQVVSFRCRACGWTWKLPVKTV